MIKKYWECLKIRIQQAWKDGNNFRTDYNDIKDKIYDTDFLETLRQQLVNSTPMANCQNNYNISSKSFFIYKDDDKHDYFIGFDGSIKDYRRRFKTLGDVREYLNTLEEELSKAFFGDVICKFEKTEFDKLYKAQFSFYMEIGKENF